MDGPVALVLCSRGVQQYGFGILGLALCSTVVFSCYVLVLCFGLAFWNVVLAFVRGSRVPAQSFSIGFYGQEFTLEGSRIYVFHLETLQTLERAR